MSYALSTDITSDLEDVLTVDSDKLGVFTLLPQSKVHVTGDTRIDGELSLPAAGLYVGGYEALLPAQTMLGADLQGVLDARYLQTGTVDVSSNIASLSLSNLIVRHSTALSNATLSGRLGVGTSNPATALHVLGEATFLGSSNVMIRNPAGSSTGCVTLSQGGILNGASNWPTYGIGCSPQGVVGVRGWYGMNMGVGTMLTNLTLAYPTGYVGIGKAGASVPLDVSGNAAVSGGLSVGGNVVAAGTVAGAGIQTAGGAALAQDLVFSGGLYQSTFSNSTWYWGSNSLVVDSNGLVPWSRIKGVPSSLTSSTDTAVGAAGCTLGAAGLVMGAAAMLNSKGMLMPDLSVQLSDDAQPDGDKQADVSIGWDKRLANRPLATCPYIADIGVYGDLYCNQNWRLYAINPDQFSLNSKNSREIPNGIPSNKCTEILNFNTQALSLKSGLFTDMLQVGPFLFKPDRKGNWSLWLGGKQLIGPNGDWLNASVLTTDSVSAPAAQGGGSTAVSQFKSHVNRLFDMM